LPSSTTWRAGVEARADDDAALAPTRRPATVFPDAAELAGEHDLAELSMGTSQDYRVAAEEGATLVRVGSVLYDR
jgi:uncharacterized pyridoxal phosphate-containing UPF0001 family protein